MTSHSRNNAQNSAQNYYELNKVRLQEHQRKYEYEKYNNDKEHKLSKDEWIFIRQKVGAIGSLLTDYLYKKK